MRRRDLVTGATASVALAACGGARARVRRGGEQRIIVIGAGLAGLVAGWELDHAGHDVTVLEARDRPGGRIETLREPFSDGLYAEAGAQFISDTHTLVRRYCKLLDVPLHRVTTRGAGEIYHVGGRRIVPSDPKAVWPMALTPEERRLGLSGMWKKYVESAFDGLKDDYDKMTGAQFLRLQGASAGAVTLLGLGYLELGGDGIGSYSALAMLRDLAHRRAEKETLAIPGGNDRLPRALAAWLGERMRYRSPVIRIEPGDRSVMVVVRDGAAPGRIEADRVVCAIPGSVLKTIEFAPPLSAPKRRAIDTVSYTSVTRVFVQTARRLGGSAPLSLTTDRPIQWVWEASAGQSGQRGILESYMAGPAARRVGLMSEPERVAFVRDELAQVLPQHGGPIERAASKAWDDDPFARGAYVWLKPGQAGLGRELARPEGRVHFAGEHLSSKPGWMEGAIESALRVVDEINAASR